MRLYLLVALGAAAGLALGAAVAVLDGHSPPPQSTPMPPAAREPASSAETAPAASPGPPPVPETAQAPTQAATSGLPPAIAAEPAPPAEPPASDLPSVDVAPRTVHTVPDTDAPAPSVTIVDRNGRALKQINPSAGLSPSYVPSVGPGGASTASRAAVRPSAMPPPSPNPRLASLPPGVTFDGKGSARGGMMLSISGRDVRLFGVRLAEGHDKCGIGPGDNRSCGDVARDALAQRLQRYPNVACRVPPGQRGDQVAICTDSSGTDLAGFLVDEGYALADTNQSFDYFGAEGLARANHRGLWRYR